MSEDLRVGDARHRTAGEVRLEEVDALREMGIHANGGQRRLGRFRGEVLFDGAAVVRTAIRVQVAGVRVARLPAAFVEDAQVGPRRGVTLI